MTWDEYKDKVKTSDPVAKQDIEKAETSAREGEIKYWIYELRMAEATRLKLESIAEKNHMTMDEFFTAVLENAIQEGKEHPLDFKRFVEHNSANSNEKPIIELVRYYPVHYGETEEEAARRAE